MRTSFKLTIAIAGIVTLGQSCAKDMTTQDFNAELAAENVGKMNQYATNNGDNYVGTLKDASGNTVGAMSILVQTQTISPGANNNTSQNVGFGGQVKITVPGVKNSLTLGYGNAYFDFSDQANYSFNPTITEPDGTTTDTIEFHGQFPDTNTMTGLLYTGKNPAPQYRLSYSLSRGAALPSIRSDQVVTRAGLSLSVGDEEKVFTGSVSASDPELSGPATMTIAADLDSDDAFYAFVSPKFQVDVFVNPYVGNGIEEQIPFRNAIYDSTVEPVTITGESPTSNAIAEILSCDQSGTGWDCKVPLNTAIIDLMFTPSSND